MNDKNLHIEKNNSEKENVFLSSSEPQYRKSKEQALSEVLNRIETEKTISVRFRSPYFYAAAVIILLLGLVITMRYYTTTITSQRGEHLVYALPDDSKVSINAESQLSYNPYWWFMERHVKLSGEAFFEVSKGEKFEVKSELGTTSVLGTSFNVFARSNNYKVDCFTGKVKVKSNSKEELILTPSYSAEILSDGSIKLSKFSDTKSEIDWINNMFSFNAVPLKEVLREVERQFNIRIEANISDDLIYSGNFSSERSVEETLNLLCKPFALEYEKINKKVYRLK